MKKFQLLTAFVLAVILNLGIATSADFPRLPVLEHFSSTNCGNCATFNSSYGYNIYSLTNNYIPNITYFVPFQGGDVIYDMDPSFGMKRYNYYYPSFTSALIPDVAVDGKPMMTFSNGTPQGISMNDVVGKIVTDEATTTPIKITSTYTKDASNKVTVNVDVLSNAAKNNLTLRVVIVERDKVYNTAPGSNGETQFFFIARHMLPDDEGQGAAGTQFSIAANETKQFSFSKDIDVTKLDTASLYVIAFVQDDATKEVLQSGFSSNLGCISYTLTPSINYGVVGNTAKSFSVTLKNHSNVAMRYQILPNTAPAADWVVDDIPSIVVQPEEKEKTITYNVTYNGGGNIPSVYTAGFLVVADSALVDNVENMVFIKLDQPFQNNVISDNTKYIYLYDGLLSSSGSQTSASPSAFFNISAFRKSPHFIEGKDTLLLPILASDALFNSNALEELSNLEFVGLTLDDDIVAQNIMPDWMKFIYYPVILQKLNALANKGIKLYISADPQLAYGTVALAQQEPFPTYGQALLDFYKNQFNISVANNPTLQNPLAVAVEGQPGAVTLKIQPTIIGIDDDMKVNGIIDTVNGSTADADGKPNTRSYNQYLDVYTIDNETTTSPVFKLEATEYVIMAKYQDPNNEKIRRIASGFDLSTIHKRDKIANDIVEWLFGGTGIEDGETNLSTRNGITLAVSPNPIETASQITLTNSNANEVHTNLYVVDLSGKKLLDVYSGMLNIGDNNISFNSNQLTSGKYFLIAETKAGKTYMSIVINK